MKKFAKLICLIAVFALILGAFAGCGAAKNTLKVATNAEFPPFENVNKSGGYEGYDIDLINAIAKKLNMKVEISNMKFDSVITSVQSGACDVGVSGLTITDERKKSVNFSDSYYAASQVVIHKRGDTVIGGSTADAVKASLSGKKIGVCMGFTGKSYVEENVKDAKEVKTYDNISLAMIDLVNGSIDCIVMDDVVAKQAANSANNKDKVEVVATALTAEDYGIALAKNNKDLTDKINKALAELKADGTVDSLVKKWINK